MNRYHPLTVALVLIAASIAGAQPVYFEDANLKAAVEEKLGKTNPTPTDMLALNDLRAEGRGIADLTGIEYATNLYVLYLDGNQINDLSPLSGLANLQGLYLFGNQISDLSPLSGLANLSELALDGNQISDLSPLSGLPGLQMLLLSANQISDLSPLSGLTNLQYLNLDDNQISDLSPLSGLANLYDTDLGYNQIRDLSPLSGMTGLRTLWLWDNQISDLSPLSGLTNLQGLYLGENGISDLSPLSGLTNLQWLELCGNQISDLSPLSGLANLYEIYLTYNQISDLSPLSSLINLQRLELSANQISNLLPLSGLTSLSQLLALGHNQISELSPLSGLINLQVLDLAGNQISALSPLSSLTNLEVLYLCINQIGDISPIANLTSLSLLWLQWNPLNAAAYDIYIPQIYANNPGIDLQYDDRSVWRTLTVSATAGGTVILPGEGQSQFVDGELVPIEAVTSDASYQFSHWSGSAVTAGGTGRVADPSAQKTTVLVDGDYTLEAVFVERAGGPVLGFSAGEIDVDDPNQFYYRVATNNTPEATFVERVTGVEPDPNGMVQIHVVEGEPARAKGRFGRCSAARVLVRFEYLFETGDATEIVVYLSDVPALLAHDDPSRPEHYVEIGRVPAPPEGCPGSFGSGRFGVFEEWAFVEGLDLSHGTWVELELASGAMLAGSPKSIQGSIRLASGDPDGSAVFDSLSVQVHCSGHCLDLNFTKTVDSQDLLLVMAACGSTAELEEGGEGSRYCLDGVFSHDGYVDAHDIYSLIWALSDLTRVDCGSLCRVPLPLVNTSGGISAGGSPAGSSVESAAVGPWPTDLLVLYKGTRSDGYGLFDGEGTYVADFAVAGLPTDSAAKVLRGAGDDVYVVSTEEGVLEIADSVRQVIPPAKVAHGSAMVYIGIQGQGSSSFGRPILDAAFDAQGYAYVVPVVVEPDDGEAYVSAAQLELQEGQGPPYRVVRLYDDPAPTNDNRYRDCLREIEVDSAGNVYVLNVHRLNESCLLWKYGSDGTVLARLSLLDPSSPAKVADPAALHVSHDGKTLYLVSGQQDGEHPGSVTLYGLSTEDLSLVRTVTIEGMPLATSITEDPATGALWVTGFRTTEEAAAFPWLPAEFTHTTLLAKVPAGTETAEATEVSAATGAASMLPVSIIWTGATE